MKMAESKRTERYDLHPNTSLIVQGIVLKDLYRLSIIYVVEMSITPLSTTRRVKS